MKDVKPSSIICIRGKTKKPAAAFRIGLRNSIFKSGREQRKDLVI